MSTNIGTLQASRRTANAFWPIVIALFAAAVLTVYVATSDREAGRSSTVSSTAANTPTELSGGLVGSIPDTAANTPTELRGGIAQSIPDTAANTPTEVRGGMPAGAASTVADSLAGTVAATHAALDAATGDDPSGSDRPTGPIGFHPLP